MVTRLDDEANIAPWLRAANRYGAKVKWAEVDIETGELPTWQWETLITQPTRLVAIASASSTLGTVTDLRPVTKLVREVGGLVVVDHSAAAPYRLIDIDEIEADVIALNAVAWGGPPVGALVFRDPQSSTRSVRCRRIRSRPGPPAWRSARISSGCWPGWWPASIPRRARRVGYRYPARKTRRFNAIGRDYMDRLFDYLMLSLRSLPLVMVIGQPEERIPVMSLAVHGVPAERVVQRLADNGVLAVSNTSSRVLDAIGVNDIGGAVTIGPGALHHDGRGGPAGPRAGFAGLEAQSHAQKHFPG